MDRRTFSLSVGIGLLGSLSRGNTIELDALAEAILGTNEPSNLPVHWQATHNRTWRWVQREEFIEGKWVLTGMTTPVRRDSGEPLEEVSGYLEDSEVPERFRTAYDGLLDANGEPVTVDSDHGISTLDDAPGPDAAQHRRNRHGRPPSRWLRTLTAAELSSWLATIEPPEAGVEGFTFAEHLARDHYFDGDLLTKLSAEELAKLHGAAHHGY